LVDCELKVRGCSVTRGLQVVGGGVDDYEQLTCFHYREGRLGPFAAIFALRADERLCRRLGKRAVGVIVYTMPVAGAELRNTALGNVFAGFDRRTRLALINRNIRCIGRVIIEPRFRGLGLASRLVRETMPMMGVPIVEAMAVMGLVNPFFEKAGMTAYTGGMPARCVQLIEAFGVVGIERKDLIDPPKVQQKLDGLGGAESEFIEFQIGLFLQAYGRRRRMQASIERTRFVVSKLTARPMYYIWFNTKLGYRV